MIPCKSPILALDAFRRASQACQALRLDYVGGGPLLPAAQQFVQALDMGDRVHLHGAQPHRVVLDLMKGADVFIQHSITDPETGHAEGLPVAILEAMAHGLPVVATRLGGIPEEVVHGETGYLAEPGDSSKMAEYIIALARERDLRSQMGQAGWRRAKDHFSWERERTSLLRILGLGNQVQGEAQCCA
jgi:glycosyltransferase involved in cell wall biosynthesis